MIRQFLIGLLLLVYSITWAQTDNPTLPADNTPKYSNEFLTLGVDARIFGMGLSSVAYIGDVSSGYWNPAGLLKLETKHQLELMHSAYFGGIANYDFGSFATKPDDSTALGFSILRFSIDDIPDTRYLFDGNGAVNYDNIRFFSASDYAFLFSYAKKLPILGGLDVAGNVKVIHRIAGPFAKSWGFGLDFGLRRDFGKWHTGLMARDVFGTFNTWTHNQDEVASIYELTSNVIPISTTEITLPSLTLGGARLWKLPTFFTILSSLDLLATFDGKRNTLIRSRFISVDPRAGVEVGFKQMVFIRIGVNQFQQSRDFDGTPQWIFQPNTGIGLKIKELSIDYAFSDVGDQAAGLYSHTFSIKVDFDEGSK